MSRLCSITTTVYPPGDKLLEDGEQPGGVRHVQACRRFVQDIQRLAHPRCRPDLAGPTVRKNCPILMRTLAEVLEAELVVTGGPARAKLTLVTGSVPW